MLYNPLLIISFLFFCLSILNPIHTPPWPSFFSEFSMFIGISLLLPFLFKEKIIVPKISLPFLFISVIPLIQYFFGQIFFYSNAILSSVYLFYFWLTLIVGYNLSLDSSCNKIYFNLHIFLAYFFLVTSFISGLFALMQWLGLSQGSIFIMNYVGDRTYANMAQPNHLATILYAGLFSSWFLFEKYKIKRNYAIVLGAFLIFSILLTQSRTAWLIAIFVLIFFIYFLKNNYTRLRVKNLFFLTSYFLMCSLSLYISRTFLNKNFNIEMSSNRFNVEISGNSHERLNSGFGRLDIWNQMYYALVEKPWFGYGWNQTTAAQFEVIDRIRGVEWATSAHNLMLDILVWCGLPLGLIIILFLFYFYLKLLINISDVKSAFSFLIISAFSIHSLLEYPLYYSYFLFPFGLLLGSLINIKYNNIIFINRYFVIFVFVINIFGAVYLFKEYVKVEDNLFAARLHAMGNVRKEVDLPYNLYFFDNFNTRAKWLALYPKMKVSNNELIYSQYMVKSYLKPYDLHKSAQLLAFNNYQNEADRQLKILEIMYGINIQYKKLLDENEVNLEKK